MERQAKKCDFKRNIRGNINRDIQLAAKTKNVRRKKAPAKRKSTTVAKPRQVAPTTKKANSLSQLLSPKNLQESLKTVVNLRSMVKNWLQYLNQADQVLDTLFITSSSLKESGVLEKLVKQKGKNLTTEDFTNILIAFMNSPLGGQFLKGVGGGQSQDSQSQPSQPQPAAQQQATPSPSPASQQRPLHM